MLNILKYILKVWVVLDSLPHDDVAADILQKYEPDVGVSLKRAADCHDKSAFTLVAYHDITRRACWVSVSAETRLRLGRIDTDPRTVPCVSPKRDQSRRPEQSSTAWFPAEPECVNRRKEDSQRRAASESETSAPASSCKWHAGVWRTSEQKRVRTRDDLVHADMI